MAIKFIANIYKQFVLNAIPETELIFHFAHLNQDLQQSVIDVIATRQPEVEEFLVAEFNSRNAKLLMSFDWDLKWIMGSSSLAQFRTQLATLILNCRQSAGTTETIFFEMNRQKLNQLIELLEECNGKLNNNDVVVAAANG